MTRRVLGIMTLAGGALAWTSTGTTVEAQDRLLKMPGYDQYARMQEALREEPAYVSGAVDVMWQADSAAFTWAHAGRLHRFDVATGQATVTGDAPAGSGAGRGGRGGRAGGAGQGGRGGRGGRGAAASVACPPQAVERGRQSACAASPDDTKKAFYRDRNLYLANADGSGEVAITTDGSEAQRIKYGTASWVYGEELGQTSAIWWSPDGSKVAFYRFDESPVKDYFLQLDQTELQSTMDVEAYPKAGTDNPIADVLVYDVAARRATTLDVRDGQPFSNAVVGHYVYNVRWSPDGTELLMNRTNRRQQIMEFVACSPATAKCRVLVHEAWLTGWTDNRPQMRMLADNRRFIWESERNGWTNYYLYDWQGRLLNPITTNDGFESGAIVRVDEDANVLFYMARDGDNPLKLQLHRVGLDGTGDRRLTDPAFTHAVTLSPDGKYFTDVYQTHDQPPATQLVDATTGAVVARLASSDLTRFEALGLKKVEMFTYLAADGKTTLHGTIAFPSTFDPSKTYPTLVPVYGGPASGSNVPTETFTLPNANTEYGFLVVNLSSRAAPGLGKRALDAIYLKLGQVEMDDMALGIKALWSRPYFDRARVGIHGSSYGGYTSVMELLRHPDVFSAASSASPVTSWRHYDTIYTERYMWIPQENEAGYDAGSAMTYVDDLRGRLLLYYGTADNNVHPNNSMQLIRALQQSGCAGGRGGRGGPPCGKSFELQVGPDAGHSNVNGARMMEFFIENLVLRPERLTGR
ncbi:MAG: DPP IV N-terminal domain-containing protein [Vicinamibacterales bacterium]